MHEAGVALTMTDLLAIGAVLLSFGMAWINLLLVRPAVARARLRRDATLVRSKIIDAVLDGHIKRDDPAASETLVWIHTLTHHATAIGWSEAIAVSKALEDLGVRPQAPNLSYNKMSPEGRRIMIEASRDLDRFVARYFIDGSRLWWVLAPARMLWRALHRVGMSHKHTPPRVSPEKAAIRVRKAAASNASDAVGSSVKAWLAPDETRHALA